MLYYETTQIYSMNLSQDIVYLCTGTACNVLVLIADICGRAKNSEVKINND
jgi:hypothetical protein